MLQLCFSQLYILEVFEALLLSTLQQYSLSSTMPPDPEADYKLFDRVVNVRMGYTVPYGLRGTVIGIIKAPDPRDIQIEVLFDEVFTSGLATRYSCMKNGTVIVASRKWCLTGILYIGV